MNAKESDWRRTAKAMRAIDLPDARRDLQGWYAAVGHVELQHLPHRDAEHVHVRLRLQINTVRR